MCVCSSNSVSVRNVLAVIPHADGMCIIYERVAPHIYAFLLYVCYCVRTNTNAKAG